MSTKTFESRGKLVIQKKDKKVLLSNQMFKRSKKLVKVQNFALLVKIHLPRNIKRTTSNSISIATLENCGK